MRSFLGTCSGEIARAVRARVYTLAAVTGVTVTRCIGRGVNGCVFMTSSSGVLKVSAHEGEAPLAMAIVGRGRVLPFLPVFHGGWLLPGALLGLNPNWELGVTYREDLRDFVPARPWWYMSRANELVGAASRAKSIEKLKARHDKILHEASLEAIGIDFRALKALSQFLIWSDESGLNYDPYEFHGSLASRNLGVSTKDDSVVIRDLGNLEPRPGAMKRFARSLAGTRRNSDAEMRRHEREAATGDVQARTRLLAGRLRTGALTKEHLAVAGWLGDAAAGAVVTPWDPRGMAARFWMAQHPGHPAREAIVSAPIQRRTRVRLAADFASHARDDRFLLDPERDAVAAGINSAREWVAAPSSATEASADAAWTRLAHFDEPWAAGPMGAAASAADSTNTEEWAGRAAEWAAVAADDIVAERQWQRDRMIAVLAGDVP